MNDLSLYGTNKFDNFLKVLNSNHPQTTFFNLSFFVFPFPCHKKPYTNKGFKEKEFPEGPEAISDAIKANPELKTLHICHFLPFSFKPNLT